MSCRIVDDELFERVHQTLWVLATGNSRAFEHAIWSTFNVFGEGTDEILTNFVNKLREVNYKSYNFRYSENCEYDRPLALFFQHTPTSVVQLHKDLTFILYNSDQISDYAIDETLQTLRNLIHRIAGVIVMNSKEWQNAEWGLE